MISFASQAAFDDSSDSSADLWETRLIRLEPDATWAKPAQAALVLTSAAMSVSVTDPPEIRGILSAETIGDVISLCVLFRERPAQRLKLAWRFDQVVTLANHGTKFITLTVMIKQGMI
jgi:hypothetical protein